MRLIKQNGKAYLIESQEDYNEPRIISSYWEINIDPDLLQESSRVERLGTSYIANNGYKTFTLNITEYPTFTEFYPIKPPKKTGYKWHCGQWIKS